MTDPKTASTPEVEPAPQQSRWAGVAREIVSGNAAVSVLAVVLALLVGAVLIAATDAGVQQASGYFFSRPLDTIRAIWDAASGAYVALFQGSIYNFRVDGFAKGIRPLTETLTFATPLIVAGIGFGDSLLGGM